MTTPVRPSARLPKPPSGVGTWGFDITRAIEQLYRELAHREIESHKLSVFASLPAAIGDKQWWFTSDTEQLFYDENGQRYEVALSASVPAALIVTDGTTTVNPTSTLSANPSYFDVVDSGGGTATLTLTHPLGIVVGELGGVNPDVDPTFRLVFDATFFQVTDAGSGEAEITFVGAADGLIVTDGITDVDPTTTLRFDADFFEVTDLGSDTAEVTFIGDFVPSARVITATAPMRIDAGASADLSADRTISVNTFGAAQAGVVPLSGGGSANFLRADGTWAAPPGGASVPAAAGIVYTDAVSLLTDAGALTWTAATNRLLVSDNSGIAGAPNDDLAVEKTTSGGSVGIRVRNVSTGANSSAYLLAQTANATGTSDAYLWLYTNSTGWSMGNDQSDSNLLKWVRGDGIGAGTPTAGTVMTLTRTSNAVLTVQVNSASAIVSADVDSNSGVAACSRYQRTGGGNSWTVGTIGNTGNLHFTLSTTGLTGGLATFSSTGDFCISSTLTATYDLDVADSKTGDQILAVRNTRNASATDDAFFYAESGGTSAGDAGLLMRIGSAGNGAYLAIDNSDSDHIVMGYGIVPGTTVAIKIYQGVGHLAFPLQYRAHVTASGDLTVANGFTILLWNTETYDVGGLHSTSANTGRFTIPADGAGNYHVSAYAAGDSNTTGLRGLHIVKNGVTLLKGNMQAAVAEALGAGNEYLDNPLSICWEGQLAAADYVEVWYRQTSGGNRTVDKDFAHFAIHKLS